MSTEKTQKAQKKLNKLEQFYLDANYGKIPLADIAKTLGRTEKFLEKFVVKPVKPVEPVEPTNAPETDTPASPPGPSMPTVATTIGRRYDDKGKPLRNGPVVMTEAASMIADKARGCHESERTSRSIFRRPE